MCLELTGIGFTIHTSPNKDINENALKKMVTLSIFTNKNTKINENNKFP